MNTEALPAADAALSVALVTGASSGIGEAFARRLALVASGAARRRGLPRFGRLWLAARRADKLEALAGELRALAPGLETRTFAVDLAVPGAFGVLAGALEAEGLGLAVLANNAGYGTYGPFDEVDLGRQLGQIDLNCRAYTEALGTLSPFLGRGSVVVNTASLAGFAPLGNFAVYAATKAYALSLSVALSAEWEGRGVKVCALCPGSVSSEFALVASGGARKEVLHGWSAERTVAKALRDAARGKTVSLPRLLWRAKRLAGVLAGPTLSARFAFRTMKRPHA